MFSHAWVTLLPWQLNKKMSLKHGCCHNFNFGREGISKYDSHYLTYIILISVCTDYVPSLIFGHLRQQESHAAEQQQVHETKNKTQERYETLTIFLKKNIDLPQFNLLLVRTSASFIENWSMREVWRARKMCRNRSRCSQEQLFFLECSLNFPVSIVL